MIQTGLTPLPRNPTPSQIADPVNLLVSQYNRQGYDQFTPIYAADTGIADAYVITPTPGIKYYIVGQPFIVQIANVNATTTPTLNVNGKGAGTITKMGGGAVAAGDVPVGFVWMTCSSTTPTFALVYK